MSSIIHIQQTATAALLVYEDENEAAARFEDIRDAIKRGDRAIEISDDISNQVIVLWCDKFPVVQHVRLCDEPEALRFNVKRDETNKEIIAEARGATVLGFKPS